MLWWWYGGVPPHSGVKTVQRAVFKRGLSHLCTDLFFFKVFFFLSFFFFYGGPFLNYYFFTILLLFCVLVFWPQDIWDLSSLTRD